MENICCHSFQLSHVLLSPVWRHEIMEMLNFISTQVMKQYEGCPDTVTPTTT